MTHKDRFQALGIQPPKGLSASQCIVSGDKDNLISCWVLKGQSSTGYSHCSCSSRYYFPVLVVILIVAVVVILYLRLCL